MKRMSPSTAGNCCAVDDWRLSAPNGVSGTLALPTAGIFKVAGVAGKGLALAGAATAASAAAHVYAAKAALGKTPNTRWRISACAT
jgi:hypothetical protein